jgi:hypothetical protein
MGQEKGKETGLRDSKGSKSPMATNDSWRASQAISDLENSGSSGGVKAARLGIANGKTKGKKRAGETPKGHSRPVRPHDSWSTPTPLPTGKLLKEGFLPHWRTKNIWGAYGKDQDARWSRCQTTAGWHRRHPGAGGFLTMAVTIRWRRRHIRDALECLTGQDEEKSEY